MATTLTALASENLNPGLSSLLQDVACGNIRVPRFQRPFVWRDEQRLLLLESIRESMPIGSLLLWRTGTLKLACFDSVGPHQIPLNVTRGSDGWQYLLDGHQRISTLLSVLIQSISPSDLEKSEGETTLDWDIQYDLMHQEFVFTKELNVVFPKPPVLPLWTLFDTRLMNRQLREMRKQFEKEEFSEEVLDDWEARADHLSYCFQQYRIPIVVMTTDDLDLAARTFQRINSQGTSMDETHLVTALTWTQDFNLRDKLAEAQQKLPVAWRSLDEKIFLQVCKGLISIDFRSVSESKLVAAINNDTNLLERAVKGIQSAIDLLAQDGKVVREDLLPYSMQLIFLAVELDYRKNDELQKNALMNWFWRTSWAEAFGTVSSRRIKAEQDALRSANAMSVQDQWHWRNTWEKSNLFDTRFARNRTWMLRVAQREDMVDELGDRVDGVELLRQYGKDAFVKLFPEPPKASYKLKRLLNSVGNRFLFDPTRTHELRKCLTDGRHISSKILKPHFIDKPELDLLHAEKLEAFLEARNLRISRWVAGEYSKVANS
jgi:hypothetical protein